MAQVLIQWFNATLEDSTYENYDEHFPHFDS